MVAVANTSSVLGQRPRSAADLVAYIQGYDTNKKRSNLGLPAGKVLGNAYAQRGPESSSNSRPGISVDTRPGPGFAINIPTPVDPKSDVQVQTAAHSGNGTGGFSWSSTANGQGHAPAASRAPGANVFSEATFGSPASGLKANDYGDRGAEWENGIAKDPAGGHGAVNSTTLGPIKPSWFAKSRTVAAGGGFGPRQRQGGPPGPIDDLGLLDLALGGSTAGQGKWNGATSSAGDALSYGTDPLSGVRASGEPKRRQSLARSRSHAADAILSSSTDPDIAQNQSLPAFPRRAMGEARHRIPLPEKQPGWDHNAEKLALTSFGFSA